MASGLAIVGLQEPSQFPARSAVIFMLRYQGSRYWPSPDSAFSPTARSVSSWARLRAADGKLPHWFRRVRGRTSPVLLPRHLTNGAQP
jgi:hypothetical protein